jgi:hypothetical protein
MFLETPLSIDRWRDDYDEKHNTYKTSIIFNDTENFFGYLDNDIPNGFEYKFK